MSLIGAVFLLLVIYQVKHFLADYILQGEYMLGKFKGGWDWVGPLSAHVAVHGMMTFVIALCFFGAIDSHAPAGFVALSCLKIALLDVVVHFCMDRLKASPKLMGRWKPVTAAEWVDAKGTLNTYKGSTYPDSWFSQHVSVVEAARKKLRGNVLFWWALGFDQAVHHLTHYACVYFILKAAGAL